MESLLRSVDLKDRFITENIDIEMCIRDRKWAFIRNVLGCFLCVILNYLFIPKYGIIGSAIVLSLIHIYIRVRLFLVGLFH